MSVLQTKVGDTVKFSKTVGESDVYLFAGLTGDLAPNHVDDEFMKASMYGERIAHGALLVGYMSNLSTRMIEKNQQPDSDMTPVSLGYDRIRFLKPVLFNDTLSFTYTIESVDQENLRSVAAIEVKNQRKELVAVAKHITKWTKNAKERSA